VPIGIIPGQKIEEFNKELSDYAKAATIFKPISGAMAGRFTSAAVVENAPKVIEGLHTPSVESENARAIAEAQAKAVDKSMEIEEETPKAHAARMGLYGRLTREVKPWQPAKLLCKRFGVKDPNPEPVIDASTAPPPSGTNEGSADPAVPDIPTFTGTESFRAPSGAGLTGRQGSSSQGRKDPSNIGLGEDDDQGRDTLTYQRPAIDVFKAIFASDEEDSDGEDDTKVDASDDKPFGVADSALPLANEDGKTEAVVVPGPTSVPQESQRHGTSLAVPEKIDPASFKPTFIPRERKKSRDKDKEKKEKKKKGERTIVSFDLDEDGGETLSLAVPKDKSKDRPKKKKRKEKNKKEGIDDDEESMWIEKPPPEAVKNIIAPSTVTPDSMDVDAQELEATDRGRKKAVDFW
jgi:G patch domain-containing protein 1